MRGIILIALLCIAGSGCLWKKTGHGQNYDPNKPNPTEVPNHKPL
jgi:hypothetical protein